MALVTLCPQCSTTFRVSSEQLEAHSGDVRCGRCQHVFNSFSTLITVEESEISSSQEADSATAQVGYNDFEEASNPQSDFNYSAEKNTATYDENESFDAVPANEKLNFKWLSASCLMIFLLIGQIVYFYRVELSVAAPMTKPLLESYCAILNCTVPYPRDIALLSIESSELSTNPKRQNETTMTAIIRNYASFPQVLPALKLSLTDKQGQLLASRIFSVNDYLGESVNLAQSIEPNHEIEVRLDYQNDDLNASGYQLSLLYP